MYKLFFSPNLSITCLRPVLSLEDCLRGANNGNLSYQTNLVRLNWMVNHIKYNGLQKPILVDGAFRIVTGDTRLMAVQLNPQITHVPVLMTSSVAPKLGWVDIKNKNELGILLNIDPENILTHHDWHDKQLDWIEFAYQHTSDHMHNEQQRERMILNYLDKYPGTIFDQDWLLERIDWSLYDH